MESTTFGFRDHPRIRGEHELVVVGHDEAQWIIPAYAGSTLDVQAGLTTWRDHPRIRGEHYPENPHTRRPGRIIPAYAGSTTQSLRRLRDLADHPRIRGEHPVDFLVAERRGGSSPHTRGARGVAASEVHVHRIIPAYAGSTAASGPKTGCGSDHPRIRGEHMSIGFRPDPDGGSSPHTRGALRVGIGRAGRLRIIPAYAGSTGVHLGDAAVIGDHPRIRGEHVARRRSRRPSRGSSPHTRGALYMRVTSFQRPGIIPAYAGSTFGEGLVIPAQADHPRIRGEHIIEPEDEPEMTGSSPHTRGAHSPP